MKERKKGRKEGRKEGKEGKEGKKEGRQKEIMKGMYVCIMVGLHSGIIFAQLA